MDKVLAKEEMKLEMKYDMMSDIMDSIGEYMDNERNKKN